MDTTILAVIGTGLALFVALWRVQGSRIDALERHVDKRFEVVDKRFEMAEKASRERSEMAERASRERSEMAEKASRERSEAMDQRWTERFEAMNQRWTERFEAMEVRFEAAERRHEMAHAAICQSIAKLDERTRADTAGLHQRLDALNGRFDDLYRHSRGPEAPRTEQTGRPAAE